MQVIITQNRDKKNGVINGQSATVLNFEQGTIFLQLPIRMLWQFTVLQQF